MKNDQKEKKANQEVLKSLKLERERFIEEQQRYEKHGSYNIEKFNTIQKIQCSHVGVMFFLQQFN